MTLTGGCQCGAIRFTASDAPVETELCHCSMCRRAVGNIHMASVSVARADIAWTGQAEIYASSPIATRGFCARCGTPLWFAYNDSERLDLMVSVIDQADALRPASHFGVEGRLEAFRHLDGLPRSAPGTMPKSPNAGARRVAELAVHRFASFDGAEIAWRELGDGPPVILLHGLFSHGEMNWLRFGHARAVADAGFRVILPDHRAHGLSAAPHDPAAYPADVLARDVEALIAHLGLTRYDLGGYSLGARATVRLIARGAAPRRAILGGMGLEGITRGLARRDFFRDAVARAGAHATGSGAWYAVQFARSTGTDLAAAVHLLGSFTDTGMDELAAFMMPTLVVCGADDRDNGSAPALAAALPRATLMEIAGNHISAVSRPGLGAAIAAFLSD